MALHPIEVVDRVITDYRSYLLTEFRARDPELRAALEAELDAPLFLAQEPFFQSHRPFKAGKAWSDLGLDPLLAKTMEKRSSSKHAYAHQSEAISHLLSPTVTPLVVTTGTGSGKTECFLLPVIQNAIADAATFHKEPGLTAVLVYPMNALANDQLERIQGYLSDSGHTYVRVARYDRSTSESERESLRKNPPHILLTNYMMLEYLLVRPADRDALFANHRCRFLVLDEVHTYRGSLGANIALLMRRVRAQLERASHDKTFQGKVPSLVPVATSATIKSVDETDKTIAEVKALRDEAVQTFFGSLVGVETSTIRCLGEEYADIAVPAEVRWTKSPHLVSVPDSGDLVAVRKTLEQLSDSAPGTPVDLMARRAAAFWTIGDLLAKKPLSVTRLVDVIKATVPERKDVEVATILRETKAALVAGAALPDGTPGALRLRTHCFIRGGWSFHRCVDPTCGKLHPTEAGTCSACGMTTAPLYLCRSCGADTLRFRAAAPEHEALAPNDSRNSDDEWLLYDAKRLKLLEDEVDADEVPTRVQEMRGRDVLKGSFNPADRSFSLDKNLFPMHVALAPARSTCLVCGTNAGSGTVLTPVALGTSAAVRVLGEGLVEALGDQNKAKAGHDGKERLLIFADSRQDAAHQARFINYSSRYDRMRRRLWALLKENPAGLSLEQAIEKLMVRAVEAGDNKHVEKGKKPGYLPEPVKEKALLWEEAPLLDDLSASAGYRNTIINLGLVGVEYTQLDEIVKAEGNSCAQSLGVAPAQLVHIARCLLDEIRVRKALARPLMRYHPISKDVPASFKAAEWERRVASPNGFPAKAGMPETSMDKADVETGITLNNGWRRANKGRAPSLERKLKHLVARCGSTVEPTDAHMRELLTLLNKYGDFLVVTKLYGTWKTTELTQLNPDRVHLRIVDAAHRRRCTVCNVRMPWAEIGAPCPSCHGTLEAWPASDVENNRYVERVVKDHYLTLTAGEHTAQVTGEARLELEEGFKGPPSQSPVNVLACSPTLEMGIDVGGLDAVVMRNVPPRPDNYAQRGGRAGRRSRVGVVIGYARRTPHDGYFFDKPEEMIAGEVPAPAVGLNNRDVIVRHLTAIALGAAEPGLKGRMIEYVDIDGSVKDAVVEELVSAFETRFPMAVDVALAAWDAPILEPVGLHSKEALLAVLHGQCARIRDLFQRVAFQIASLSKTIEAWTTLAKGDYAAVNAMELKRRLLGLPADNKKHKDGDADDRSAGHPMRRFAEFGVLPGYEFPREPATLRLLGDKHEEEPVSVERRFGLAQYQPDAPAHARGHKWRVSGLDLTSPWNPRTDEPQWHYVICGRCGLHHAADQPKCPRCKSTEAGKDLPAFEWGGFLAVRNDTPVLEEEDRFSARNLLRLYPQWTGDVIRRVRFATGWRGELRREESLRWLNESRPVTDAERKRGDPALYDVPDGPTARGFYLCPTCGRILSAGDAEPGSKKSKGNKKAKSADQDHYGHAASCSKRGLPPTPHAISTSAAATTLRVLVDLPLDLDDGDYASWGNSLGAALRIGMRQLYMLDGPEVEFELETPWLVDDDKGKRNVGCLTFVDPAVGGSGFLERAAAEIHLVARRAIEHLDHRDCESACYRCLRSYTNQRVHSLLNWPRIIDDLHELAAAAPVEVPQQLGDVHDPTPWLEAYAAGAGSPLELQFLKRFTELGIEVEKQVPIALVEGGKAGTIADFIVKGRKTAIYIDGAAFHTGDRLRRDRFIRERLAEAGWHVVSLRRTQLESETLSALVSGETAT